MKKNVQSKAVLLCFLMFFCSSLPAIAGQLETFETNGFTFLKLGSFKVSVLSSNYLGRDVVIPEKVKNLGITYTVTSIEDRAFFINEITSVTIPNSVTTIGNEAFCGCYYLKSVSIGNSVTSIGSQAFRLCKRLASVTIPESVTSIGNDAFDACDDLSKAEFASIESLCKIDFANYAANPLYNAHHLYINGEEIVNLVIPESVTSIGNYALSGYNGMTSIAIPNSVTSIGVGAFYGCSGLTSVTIPNSVTAIREKSFLSCSHLTSVTISNSAKSIADSTFCNCDSLTSVTIPDSIKSIGMFAFENCANLTSLSIGNSVTSIGKDAFAGCSGLKTVNFNAVSCEAYRYGKSPFPRTIEVVKIGDKVKTLPENIFHQCKSLTSLTIGNFVTSIGEYAFAMTGLTSVTIPNSVTTIGNFAFRQCESLTSVVIGNSVTSIGDYAFESCSSLTSMTIGNSVTSIGRSAFEDCSGLTSVTIPSSVTSIGGRAFADCSAVTSVTIGNSVTSIGGGAFHSCSGLTSVTIPNSVTSIGNYAFKDCSGLTSVTIGNSVTSIGDGAFEDCSGLTSVTIGNSVTSIGDYAFRSCDKLKKVAIPYNVGYTFNSDVLVINYDGNSAYADSDGCVFNNDNTELLFAPCSLSNDYTIPNSVTAIGESAFSRCSDLSAICVSENVEIIGLDAFKDCTPKSLTILTDKLNSWSDLTGSELEDVTIGGQITKIPNNAFYGCSGLTSITIPNSVTSIGESAFYGCRGLTSVTIPEAVTTIGKRAFFNCGRLRKAEFASIELLCSIDFGNLEANPLLFAHHLYINGKEITNNLVIPESVTSIGKYAFNGCSGLTSLIIPNKVRSIGTGAFANCDSLESAILGTGITSLATGAFSYSPLIKVAIPSTLENPFADRVTTISYDAFDSSIGDDGCVYTRNREAIYFAPAYITDEYEIPSTVRTIKDKAFGRCSNLTRVKLSANISEIGEKAWYLCYDIRDVEYLSENPCVANENIFCEDVYSKATLHVPTGMMLSYKNTNPWSYFYDISDEQDVMGIDDITNDSPADLQIDYTEPYDVYNMQGVYLGQSVDGLIPGFYIIRQGAATAKIAIR